MRAAAQGTPGLLRGAGAFPSNSNAFTGAAGGMEFDCSGGVRCKAVLTGEGPDARLSMFRNDALTSSLILHAAQGARFAYTGDQSRVATWPPSDANTGARQMLRAVDVVKPSPAGDDTLVHTRVWAEQPMRCAYDMIAEACR